MHEPILANHSAREVVIPSRSEVDSCNGRQASNHKPKRLPVLTAQQQQLSERPASAQASVEEVDFLFQIGRPPVIAEKATVDGMLQRPHRVLRRIGEQWKGLDNQ